MKEEILKFFKGEVYDDPEMLQVYSSDASLLEVKPKLVVFPKDSSDLEKLVSYVKEKKSTEKDISLTIRSAGSCMSGGSLNESIIADVTKHMNKVREIDASGTWVMPGCFYRDFEPKTLEKGLILPCYTASKNLCALGGMFGNNAAGEKTLRYGKMENFVRESKIIFSDGREYTVSPLTKKSLEDKISQGDFEGNLYKNLLELIEGNQELINNAKPKVSKNSAGYYLWNVWDGETFDLNKLLVGSQGTLGLMTEMKLALEPVEPVSKLYVIFLPNLENIANLVNAILPTSPESLESYDDATLKLAMKFLPEMLKSMKSGLFKLLWSFIPEAIMTLRGGMPKLVLLVEYAGQTEEEVDKKLMNLEEVLKPFKLNARRTKSQAEAEKYWTIRRESFNLLRKHVRGARTAPFVDDVVVRPEAMPEFLPKMREILDNYKLTYTIAGHAGNGNFHIIPLMNMKSRDNVRIIKEVSNKVYDLVKEYGGSITGEHNDGIIRTPYLDRMYSPEMLKLFKEVKKIFDPQNIFNPGKKVPIEEAGKSGTLEYMTSHIA